MQIFIYRPDLRLDKNVDLNYVYTKEGKPFFEWRKEQEILRDYKWQKAKEKIEEKPDWKVWSY